MTTQHKSQSLLVKGARKPQEGFLIPVNDLGFEQNMLRFPDHAAATEVVGEQTGLNFDAQNPERIVLERQLHEAQTKADELKAKRDAQNQVVKDTPEYFDSSVDDEGNTAEEVPFGEWKAFHRFSYKLLSTGFGLMCVVSGVNVYSNIMASEEVVFLDQPWLAALISVLAPCAGLAIKFISHFFDTHKAKKQYAGVVFALTALSLLIWMILFSVQFNGVSSGFDIEAALDGAGGKGSPWLVFFQLFSEVATSAALFLAMQNIEILYTPELKRNNPEYPREVSLLNGLDKQFEAALQERDDIHKRFTVLDSQRQSSINAAIASFNAMRSRINANSNY